MPLNRTPPSSPAQAPPPATPAPAAASAVTAAPALLSAPLTLRGESRTGSEPNLHHDFESDAIAYATQRNTKRKRDEICLDHPNEDIRLFFEQMFKEWTNRQDAKNNTILKTMTEIKDQNSAITASLDFMSNKYDELLNKFSKMEEECVKNRTYIKTLENRIEFLERSMRSSCIEIKNIPKPPNETKADIVKIIQKIGKAIDVDINTSDVADVRRINTKTDNKPIILQLTSVLKKEFIIKRLKQFNKDHMDEKLNTGHLNYKTPLKPIYITEHVTPETRRLYQSCREFSKDNQYTFCWIAGGRVYLRKSEGQPAIRIDSTSDLSKLSTK